MDSDNSPPGTTPDTLSWSNRTATPEFATPSPSSLRTQPISWVLPAEDRSALCTRWMCACAGPNNKNYITIIQYYRPYPECHNKSLPRPFLFRRAHACYAFQCTVLVYKVPNALHVEVKSVIWKRSSSLSCLGVKFVKLNSSVFFFFLFKTGQNKFSENSGKNRFKI